MRETALGFLKTGDSFVFGGITYGVGHLIDGTNGYVACTDMKTKKTKRFHIDAIVEEKERK